MRFHDILWLELGILSAILGSAVAWLPRATFAGMVGGSVAALACSLCVWMRLHLELPPPTRLVPWLGVDGFSSLLLPLVALLHLLISVSTPRSKADPWYCSLLMASLAIQLATFGCIESRALLSLLALGTLIPWVALVARGKPSRLFARHMMAFLGLLVAGVWCAEAGHTLIGQALILAGVMVRCGSFPAHSWVPSLLEHARFGTALAFTVPLVGVYAAIRLGVTNAPDSVLKGLGVLSLLTAVGAAGLAIVQNEARRFLAFLLISHASLVLVGLEIRTAGGLAGAFSLWLAGALSLAGLGLAIRSLESRFGPLSMADYRGMYRHSPSLAGLFLLMGLATVGFPGTLGHFSTDLLVDGALTESAVPGTVIVLAGALNGIAVMRAFFQLFSGPGDSSTVPIDITPRERYALIALALLLLAGGLFPQAGLDNRTAAAREVLGLEPVKVRAGH